MCLKLLLWDDFERLIWCLDHWLSCILDCIHVCVFLFSKNCFYKVNLTPPRHLAICRALKFFLSQSRHLLDTWWIDRGSLLVSLLFPQHLLDSCICRCCFSQHLPQQMAWHLLTLLSVKNYWGSIYMLIAIRFSFPRSLSIGLHQFISQTLFPSHLTSSSSILWD